MLERFKGDAGKQLLIEVMSRQFVVEGDQGLAAAIAAIADLVEYKTGAHLMHQGDAEHDLYFILEGKFSIQVNGEVISSRSAGEDIGEMALIDPMTTRSASAIALEDSVVAMIAEEDFTELANKYPKLWRAFARQQGNRLRQLNERLSDLQSEYSKK